MSFLEQPNELIYEQLARFPIEDLLSACRTNLRLAEVCRTPALWKRRLELEFPQVKPTGDLKGLYLEQVEKQAWTTLQAIIKEFGWNLAETTESNMKAIDAVVRDHYSVTPELVRSLTVPIPGLHRLVVYYQVSWNYRPRNEANYFHRVEYTSNEAMTPLQVIEEIARFYQEPYTQTDEDKIAASLEIRPRQVPPGATRFYAVLNSNYLEGLRPHLDGVIVDLGS